jgi:hypothetical protein
LKIDAGPVQRVTEPRYAFETKRPEPDFVSNGEQTKEELFVFRGPVKSFERSLFDALLDTDPLLLECFKLAEYPDGPLETAKERVSRVRELWWERNTHGLRQRAQEMAKILGAPKT